MIARPARKPRCPACRCIIEGITSWECPRCRADLREIGFAFPQSWLRQWKASIVAIVRRLRRKPRHGPTCGKCDYSTRGLGGFQCPECGSDLREVGVINRDRIDPRIATVLVAALWTVVFAAGAFAAFDWASLWLVPQSMVRRERIDLDSMVASPSYRVYIRGLGQTDQWRFQGQAPLDVIDVVFTLNVRQDYGNYAEMRIKRAKVNSTYIGGGPGVPEWKRGWESSEVERDMVLDVMSRIQLDKNTEVIQAHADELVRMLTLLQTESIDLDSITGFKATGSTVIKSKPQGLHGRLVYAYFYGLWVLTTAIICWRFHRRLRRTLA